VNITERIALFLHQTENESPTAFAMMDRRYEARELLNDAEAEIERLQAERDECRRLLLQVADEWDRLNRNKPGNRPIAPIVLLREWREAARAAGGEE
jgi:hypothetical protein